MDMQPKKKKRDRSLGDNKDWLDREWGGKDWLPVEVRLAHENPPYTNAISLGAVNFMVKITKLAKRENISLPLLWKESEVNPFSFLWTGVKNSPSMRLTAGIAESAHNELKSLLDHNASTKDLSTGVQDSVNNGEAGVIKDSDIEEDSLDLGNESSDNEDIDDKIRSVTTIKSVAAGGSKSATTEPPHTPSRMSISDIDRRALTVPPFVQSPPIRDPPRTSGAAPASPILGSSYHSSLWVSNTASKRKRERDTITEGKPAKKRAETAKRPSTSDAEEAASIYHQLTNNDKLTSATIDLLVHLIIAHYAPGDAGLRVAYPLWFQLNSNPAGPLKDNLEHCTKFCFVIHHPHPKHWTLAVVEIFPKRMVFNHHDSIMDMDNGRFDTVCSRFREWKEQQKLDYELEFKRVTPCTAQLDNINCGIHVVSCLRHELTGKPCPPHLDPTKEREGLIRLVKLTDEKDYSGNKNLFSEVKRVVESREKKELWKVIERATPESLEEEARNAELARNAARDDLEAAQAAMGGLYVKKDTLIMARDRINQAFVAENISPATNLLDLSIRDLSSREGVSQQAVITSRAQTAEFMLKMSYCDASDLTKGVFQQLSQEIHDEIKRVEVDVEQKKKALKKAEHLVNHLSYMRNAKEAMTNMLSQRNN
ncbi:hypothetical protein F53441_14487 [Fusarium austroafricanum]|uniref:Ubiquitin-like protease family profile domain-containing protein n=1 Tax=Fusarium austroafricanum TaxID=2364996 RepID=A0A8H4JDP4_9HYPO|nr:hypothetical protein F53441_14487 [Fusarium austroafricanum]